MSLTRAAALSGERGRSLARLQSKGCKKKTWLPVNVLLRLGGVLEGKPAAGFFCARFLKILQAQGGRQKAEGRRKLSAS